MKITIIICCLISFFTSSCAYSQDCDESINKLPLYGNAKKCAEQIQADREFITYCEKVSTRKDAAAHMVMRGWEYFHNKNLDTAMMRFNQAWLLDSLNAEVYWGFGDILGAQGKFKESLPFFKKSLQLNPNNAKAWHDQSTSEGNVFMQTRDVKVLANVIYSLKKAICIESQNAQFYGELTGAYSYFMQKDSARKYLKITDKLDPNAVPPDVRTMLTNK